MQTNQNDFEYDTYGNLIIDRNKGITNITYNHLHLPKTVFFGSENKIEYFYDANGVKVMKKVKIQDEVITRYLDGFQYSNSILDFFPHAEGYVSNVKSSSQLTDPYFHYVFNYTDHLGNIRLRFTNNPKTDEITILEEDHYYPFGLKHNGYNSRHDMLVEKDTGVELVAVNNFFPETYKYKFNGQEYNQDFGLNLTEMDFRMYDNALGRFNVMDEMSELAYDVTPYRFGFNNPIYFSDPTGLWEEVDGGYTTNDQDEIARFMGYLKHNENADKSTEGMMNFIKEDIAFFESFDNKGLRLSTAYISNRKVTDHSIHRMKNEIAYYEGYTDYLYTREDYEMRNKILADGGKDPISRVLLGWEQSGNYQPITASNYINYVGGEKTARLLTVHSFMDMMGSVSGGPSSVSRSVTPRYLGTRTNQGSLAARNKVSGGIGTSSTVLSPKDMNWQQFRQQYSHLYRGKFQGRGTYLKFMAMDYNAMKAGLRE